MAKACGLAEEAAEVDRAETLAGGWAAALGINAGAEAGAAGLRRGFAKNRQLMLILSPKLGAGTLCIQA